MSRVEESQTAEPASVKLTETAPKRVPSVDDVAGGYALLKTEPPKNPGKGSRWTCHVLACDRAKTGLAGTGPSSEEAWRNGLLAALEAGAVRVKFQEGPGGLKCYSQLVRYLPLWRSRSWKTCKGSPVLGGEGVLERLYAMLSRPHPFAKGVEPTDGYSVKARRWIDLGEGPTAELLARRVRVLWPDKADSIRKRFLPDEILDHPPVLDEPRFSEWLEDQKRRFKSSMVVDAPAQELFYEHTEQHDPRWFEGRAYRGSASKAGAYTGSNKHEPFDKHLLYQTWEEYKPADSERSKANMARGNLREPDARCRHREVRLRQILEVEIPLAEAKRPGWKVVSVEWESFVGGVWLPVDPELAGLACSDDGVITETWTWMQGSPERSTWRVDLDDRDDKRVKGFVLSDLSDLVAKDLPTKVEQIRYLAEYKCPVVGAYERVPPYYTDQVQYILGMRGLPFAHFGVWGEASFRFDRLDFDRQRFEFILDCMLRGQDKFFEAAVLKSYGISRYPEVSLDEVRQRLLLEEDEAFAEPPSPEEEVELCSDSETVPDEDPNQFVPTVSESVSTKRFQTLDEFGLI
jgi:hypothetical protein